MHPKVLFIKPDFPDITIMPHIGIGYLIAILRSKMVGTHFIDNGLLRFDDEKIAESIKEFSPNIVGITASTPMIKRALELADLIKKLSSEIKIILGGCHPSVTVYETFKNNSIDCIVRGEGEQIIYDLIMAIYNEDDLSGIPSIAYRKNGEINLTKEASPFNELDTLPFPAFDSMGLEDYFKRGTKMGFQQKSLFCVPLIGTRGCPGRCTFCQRYLGNKFRKRSPENIVDEIKYWNKKYHIKEFNFVDDNFTFDKKYAITTLEKILNENLKITIRFPNGVREDFLDDELLTALKAVGCNDLEFGFESGCQKTLNLMKKGKEVEKMAEKAYLCKRHGFKIGSNFLFGTPGETLEDMDTTIKFALSLPLDKAGFGIVIPFPGTEVREEAIRKNYLVHNEYDKYNPIIEYCRPALQTPEWSGGEVMMKVLEARRKYYLRTKYLVNNAFKVLTSKDTRRYARMFFTMLHSTIKKGSFNFY